MLKQTEKNHNRNLSVKLKQKYFLWKTESEILLRFLKNIFIISVRNLFFVFLKANFHGHEICSHVIFSSCNIIMKTDSKIYLKAWK